MRKEMRYKVTTVHRRGLDQLHPRVYSPSDLHSMATTLRKKKNVNKEFLADLSQALAESEQNSVIFCGIDGSLQSLCTFLTGGDSALQLEAAYCVANAAVWEDENRAGSLLATITGAYLVTLLGSGNSSLQEACCWALGNMLPQGKSILFAQGFIDKVLTLFDSPHASVRSSAVQCLVQFLSTSSPSDSDVDKIAGHADKLIVSVDLDLPSLCWLFYLLSCYPSCDGKILVSKVIVWSFGRLREQLSGDKKVVIIIPLVRFLGNLLNSSYEPICKETLLLVANIVNNSNPQIQSTLLTINFKNIWEKTVKNVIALF